MHAGISFEELLQAATPRLQQLTQRTSFESLTSRPPRRFPKSSPSSRKFSFKTTGGPSPLVGEPRTCRTSRRYGNSYPSSRRSPPKPCFCEIEISRGGSFSPVRSYLGL